MVSSLLNFGPVALLMALTLVNLGTIVKVLVLSSLYLRTIVKVLALPSLYLGQKTLYFLFNFNACKRFGFQSSLFFYRLLSVTI